MAFLGHVYRKDDVERQVLTGRIQGKRDCGRQRMTFLQSLKAGFHLNECNDSAEAARVGACVVGSNVDSPAADLGRIG